MSKSIHSFCKLPPLLLWAVLLLFNIKPALAEVKPGTITGTITTADGQTVPGVTVSLNGNGISAGTVTSESGRFTFNKVKPGSYTIKVTFVGLAPEEKAVELADGQRVTVNFMLRENANQIGEVLISGRKQKYKIDAPSPSLRLNEPLLEVAQNIQVVSSDQIKDQQIFNMLEGVSRNVSGLTMQEHWGNYARVNARGDRLAPFRNGMNIEATWGPLTEDMSFVDRIEFVKGPAAFMLANGNPSGFYNVVTKKPTGTTSRAFSFTTGSFNSYRATADFDGVLTKDGKLQYRLNLMGQLSKSWRPYDFTNRTAIAPVLRYKFNSKNTLTAEYTYQYQRMNAFGTAYLFSTDGYATLPRNFTNAPSNSPSSGIRDQSAFLTYEHTFNSKWKVTAQGAYFYYKQTAYSYWINSINSNGDVDRNLGLWDAVNKNKFAQAFLNGEFNTGKVVHRLLSGLDIGDKYYIPDYFQSGSLDPDPANPFNIHNPNNAPVTLPVFDRSVPLSERGKNAVNTEKYQSFYVQDELGFFDQKLRLTVAGRYTHATTTDPYAGDTKGHKFTPRFGLSVNIDPTTTAYAVYDQSFVPQTGKIYGGQKVKPITGNNMELGLKRDWFDGKWNTTLSAYQILKNNQLVTDPDKHGESAANYVLQLGQTKTKGVEFDTRGEIITGLSLMVNYAYTDSKISKDTDPANVGNPVPGFAKHVTNAWLTYRLQHGSLKGLGFSTGYQWQLDRLPWSLGTGTSDLPNYFRLDAGASYQIKKMSFALNVNNVLNKYLYSGGHEGLSTDGKTVYSWQAEAPTNVRLSIGYKF
ncbi:TonB-dependent receptor [Mucilaginibacter gossypii]|uniref:TonB-dependent receptor n=1 Tax=Mucilaginibacter gossypii TaxID=551996 RepID=UPI000DCECDE3|nr:MULTISPECIES: TonB-dependent receptor [Mucilaginibacter]QTE36424.1 TonB-dependent receptor [Mucilaginibacter gossypii]RAV55954.1 TonB-dependent siderophore receptor [Mucilaginibacter rubeus]